MLSFGARLAPFLYHIYKTSILFMCTYIQPLFSMCIHMYNYVCTGAHVCIILVSKEGKHGTKAIIVACCAE